MVRIFYQGKNHEISDTDSQRAKLYRAEQSVNWPQILPHGDRGAVLAYAKKVMASACFRRLLARWGGPESLAKSKVSFGHGSRRSSTAYTDRIVFAPNAVKLTCAAWHVLHEVAHIASPGRVHHHWPFASAYLELVRRFLGKDAADMLKVEFRACNVRWKPRKKREMSPEQREAVKARMAAMRAARGKP